jgi:hypothetical protein
MPDCVLSVVRGFYPNPPSQPCMGHKWLWHYFNFFVTITFIDDSSAFSFVLFLSHLSVIIFWKHCFKTFLQFVWSSMDTYSTILEINWGISEASILHVFKHVCMNQHHVLCLQTVELPGSSSPFTFKFVQKSFTSGLDNSFSA